MNGHKLSFHLPEMRFIAARDAWQFSYLHIYYFPAVTSRFNVVGA